MRLSKCLGIPAITGVIVLPNIGVSQENVGQEPLTLEAITVIGTTPIHGIGLEKKRIPASVQTADSEDLEQAQSLNLAEYLRFNFNSVSVNEAVNNPFQPDIQYRGFTASPLLGLPQGLSVYVNGIRFNEPFGDTVNWDLVPEGAIDSINLFAGSNPVFGQNTLGGALSIRTKTGFSYTESQVEVSGGEFGRFGLEAQTGGNNGELGYYLIGNYYEEDGWRDFSPSRVRQGLANLSWRRGDSLLEFTGATSNNSLIGNGAVPLELMPLEGREAIYTQPDKTENNLALLALNGETWLSDTLQLAGNVYYRHSTVEALNGDDSDYDECVLTSGPNAGEATLCEEGDVDEPVSFAGNAGFSLEDLAPTLEADELDGTLNTSKTEQQSGGIATQVALLNEFQGRENQLIVGGNYDFAAIEFESDTQLAVLRNATPGADRGVSGVNLFDVESRVRLDADVQNAGIFFTNTLALSEVFDLTLSGRYNRTQVKMEDQNEDGALDGDHTFNRFNPALGFAWQIAPISSVYGSYSVSSRAPTPAELSCADPEDPCKLPNGFVADPPLEQVVAKTFEAGIRGYDLGYRWNVGVFHTINHDDIIFQQAGGAPSEGFFANVGRTRRMGLELAGQKRFNSVTFGLGYTLLDATYQTPYTSFSPNNPRGPDRQVEEGDSIPGLPMHNLKITADWDVTSKLHLGAIFSYQSSQYYRGDEANENPKIDGFSIVNLRAMYEVIEDLEVFGHIDNVLDQEYETFGVYGESDEVLEAAYPGFDDERFVAPGKPRALVVGVRARF